MSRFIRFVLAGICAALILACFSEKQTNAPPAGNEVWVGTLFLEGGRPAVHARVRVYPVDHAPNSIDAAAKRSAGADPTFSTFTDSEGEYQIGALPQGEYNVLGDLDGAVSYQDSVFLSEQSGSLSSDTLSLPGSLEGSIRLQPDHNPISATVQVLGTYYFANVDAKGRFTLPGLAGGVYTVRILANRPSYSPLYVSARVRSGTVDTLEGELRPPYTGIPVVTGIRAEYDTLRGIVSLAWDKPEYRDLSDYLIYRDSSLAFALSDTPIGRSHDTVFLDTLYFPSATGLFTPDDTRDRLMAYRIKVRNKSNEVGLSYGTAEVTVAAPAKVRTRMSFRVGESLWDSTLQGDSISVAVLLRNPTRGLASLTWHIGDSLSGGITRELGSRLEESDTLRFFRFQEGAFRIHVRVQDAAGSLWEDSVILPGNTGPRLSGKPETKAAANLPYRFAPSAAEPDSDALVFSIANLPAWARFDSLTGLLSGTPDNSDAGLYGSIRISVTDGRRSDTLPPFDLRIESNAWSIMNPLAEVFQSGFSRALDGAIYLFRSGYNPQGTVDRYDPDTDAWSRAVDLPESWLLKAVHLIDGRFHVVTTPLDGSSPQLNMRVYDPAAGTWTDKGPLALANKYFASAESGGRIYFFPEGLASVQEYDPVTNALTAKSSAPKAPNPAAHAFGLKGRIYLLGGSPSTGAQNDSMPVYIPSTDSWIRNPAMKAPRTNVAACALDDRLYAMGGSLLTDSRYSVTIVEEFDTKTSAWTLKSPMPTARMGAACSEAGGKLHLFGGMGGFGSSDEMEVAVERYDPAQDP
jgi:hypothetical protein